MIRVLCSVSELEEDGEVVTVGDRVERQAEFASRGFFGTELDRIRWHFDQYAEARVSQPWLISGTVESLSAVYVALAQVRLPRQEWMHVPGSARLEPLESTRETRSPQRERERTALLKQPPPADVFGSYGHPLAYPKDGDEDHAGWCFTLVDETVRPWPSAAVQPRPRP
ncbi:hypothetical protein HDC34_003328 [Pseudoclavibacter sp. JAI123]|uniref:hypothetical protein n=1 Tax=Pseudoclavibacter sp. JAI123 TaxID=2723065 RepID=UPI0015CE8C44|nr:hypothetical protein [Pseudoclavibacter sp. JAI123]NYF14993.1 hypothetical protein [Pseudoclavibacter sp. JAI123]